MDIQWIAAGIDREGNNLNLWRLGNYSYEIGEIEYLVSYETAMGIFEGMVTNIRTACSGLLS